MYVEWLNVTGGADASPDWVHSHLQIAREGAVYVGVSAQFVGVNQLKNGGPRRPPAIRLATQRWSIPATATRTTSSRRSPRRSGTGGLLGGLEPRRVMALGESQSAGRLVTYINAVQPLADVYDGFVVHSRDSGGAPLSQAPLPSVTVSRTDIRDDLDVPVIVFQSEVDVAGSALLARQPETRMGKFRLWEVAGTAALRRLRPDHRPDRHR